MSASQPAWSLGKTDRFQIDQFQKKDRELQNVAPGSYQASLADKPREPTWSMAARLKVVDKRISASPDQYNIPSKIVEAQGRTMGMRLGSSLSQASKLQAPGPGAYGMDKAKLGNFQYSMGAKFGTQKRLEVPGPGSYDARAQAIIESVKAVKFGTGQRSAMALKGSRNVPGPGGHSPDFRALKTSQPKYGFGSEFRNNKDVEKMKYIPGPGSYQIPGVIGREGQSKTLHSTLLYSPETKENRGKPGPGAYDGDVLRTRKAAPDYKVGTSQRLDLAFQKKQMFSQDPGSYHPSTGLTKTAASRWGFGTEKRLRTDIGKHQASIPGAGTYQIPSRLVEGPSYGMGAKFNDRGSTSMDRNPGPGAYELQDSDNLNMRQGQKFGMGTSNRPGLAPRSITTVPGPGNYNTSLADKTSNPNYGFGTSQRAEAKGTGAPGPGQYQAKPITGAEGRGNTMHSKIDYKPIEKTGGATPGPGAYEYHANNKARDPQWGTGTGQRSGDVNKSVLANPGPGGYSPSTNYTLKADPRFGFGTDKRKGPVDPKRNISPGPGGYDIASMAFDGKQQKFYVGQKLPALKATTNVPGAGSYNPQSMSTPKLPSYIMGQKLDSSLGKANNMPGPGSYESNLNDKRAAAKFGFGSSQRPGINGSPSKHNGPGPGAYRVPVKISDLQQFAMPNRDDRYKYV